MSKDKVRILINILAESHMAFDWEIKSTFDSTQTDRPALFSTSSCACARPATLMEATKGLAFC